MLWLLIPTTMFMLQSVNCKQLTMPGSKSLQFNAIVPVYSEGNNTYKPGNMLIEAVHYAVEQVNHRNYLNGFKLELNGTLFSSLDYDNSKKLVNFFIATTLDSASSIMVGPDNSQDTFALGIYAESLMRPVISYGATSIDHTSSMMHLAHTIPSDLYRIAVVIHLVKALQWNYLTVVSSFWYSGTIQAERFTSKLYGVGICLAKQFILDRQPKKSDYQQVISAIDKEPNSKAVVLFTGYRDSRELLKVIKNKRMEKRFLLVFVYGRHMHEDFTEGVELAMNGALVINVAVDENLDFRDYFFKKDPFEKKDFKNYLSNQDIRKSFTVINMSRELVQLRQNTFNCSYLADYDSSFDNRCTGKERFSHNIGYYPYVPVNHIIRAVYGAAYILKQMLKDFCPGFKKGHCSLDPTFKYVYSVHLYKYLKKSLNQDGTFKRTVWWDKLDRSKIRYDIRNFVYKNGVLRNGPVGHWCVNIMANASHEDVLSSTKTKAMFHLDIHKISWADYSVGKTPAANCSKYCEAGFVLVRDSQLLKAVCCWSCTPCKTNHVVVNNTCVTCKDTEKADIYKNVCVSLPEKYWTISHYPYVIILIGFSGLGLCAVVMLIIFFIRYSETGILKATGQKVWFMTMFSAGFMFLCPFLFMLKPEVTTCVIRGQLPTLSFALCYAALCLKIYDTKTKFLGAKSSVAHHTLLGPRSYIYILFMLVIFQLLTSVAWYISTKPGPEKRLLESHLYSTIHCHGDDNIGLIIMPFCFSILILILAIAQVIKVRHLPQNYQETRSIFATLFVSMLLWTVFIPAYCLTPGKEDFAREYQLCGVCIVLGYVTIIGLFSHKVTIALKPSSLAPIEGCEARNRAMSQGMKPENKGISMSDSQQDIKALINAHCPPRPRRFTANHEYECRPVYAGDITVHRDSV